MNHHRHHRRRHHRRRRRVRLKPRLKARKVHQLLKAQKVLRVKELLAMT
jgi:hypothetical protein